MRHSLVFGMTLISLLLQETHLLAEEGLYVHQIVVSHQDQQIIYVSTDNQGMLRSSDGGKTWSLINNGIKSYLLYELVELPKEPHVLYIGSWGGGVYRSTDSGHSWTEKNYGLGNTAIQALIISPEAGTLYAATSTGVYRGRRDGDEWNPMSKGLSLQREELPQCLILISSKQPILYLGTNRGIYRWTEDNIGWLKIGDNLEIDVTAFAYDSRTNQFYAGTIDKWIYKSDDKGEEWQPLKGPEKVWINQIALHPVHPETLYVVTRDRGILKTEDGGKSWGEVNSGIEDQWVNTLTFDPKDPETLYAGTHDMGIYKSDNGGARWRSLLNKPIQSPSERNLALIPEHFPKRSEVVPLPPEAFKKCNECHGWTDSMVNFHLYTYYRMTANHRDWTETVKRMSRQAQLLPEEEAEIIQYLNNYFGLEKAGK